MTGRSTGQEPEPPCAATLLTAGVAGCGGVFPATTGFSAGRGADDRRLCDGSQRVMTLVMSSIAVFVPGTNRRPNPGCHAHVGHADRGLITNAVAATHDGIAPGRSPAGRPRQVRSRSRSGRRPVRGSPALRGRSPAAAPDRPPGKCCPAAGFASPASKRSRCLASSQSQCSSDGQGRSCPPPGRRSARILLDPRMDFLRLRDDQHAIIIAHRPVPPLSVPRLGGNGVVYCVNDRLTLLDNSLPACRFAL